MRLVLLVLGLAASGLFPSLASACLRPPAELVVHHAELVKRATWIALARADSYERFNEEKYGAIRTRIRTTFTTVEAIKGETPRTFSKVVTDEYAFRKKPPHEEFKDRPNADFHGHTDWDFWEDRGARQWNGADCDMHPEFEMGATYLIFDDPYGHWKGYERIDRPDDRWLAAVRTLVAAPKKRSGYQLSLTEYLKAQEGVFIGRAVACADAVKYKYLPEPKYEFQTYGYTLKIKESFPRTANGSLRFQRVHFFRCTEGNWYLVVLQKGEITTIDEGVLPQGRLIPLLNAKDEPATAFSDKIHIDINALGSETLVTDDAKASVARIRELLSPKGKRHWPPVRHGSLEP